MKKLTQWARIHPLGAVVAILSILGTIGTPIVLARDALKQQGIQIQISLANDKEQNETLKSHYKMIGALEKTTEQLTIQTTNIKETQGDIKDELKNLRDENDENTNRIIEVIKNNK